MKICLLSTLFPPNCGGTGYYVYHIARRLVERGHKVVTIVRGNPYQDWQHENIDGIDVYKVRFIPVYPFHVNLHGLFIKKLIRHLSIDFDIFHLNIPLLPYIDDFHPYVVTQHSIPSNEISTRKSFDSYSLGWRAFKPYIHHLDKKVSINATTVVAISLERKRELQQIYGINESKIVIVPTGVDTQYFSPSEKPEQKNKNVLFVGRIDAVKGIENFVTCASHIHKEDAGIKFIVAGKGIGNMERNIKHMVLSLNLEDNFQFMGAVDQSVVRSCYRYASVYVLPSYYEGLSLSLLEAMSCAAPCVATDIPGNREVIKDGVDGILVEAGNPEVLAKNILMLLNDKQRSAELGMNAREKIRNNYDWDIIVDRLEDIYKSNLKKQ